MTNYQINTATETDIVSHLKSCDETFFFNLSEKVDIRIYSQKLKTNAILFEAWRKSILIGLIAAYYNCIEDKIAYITNVSISKKNEGKGIASELMKKCIVYGQSNNFKKIKLEVAVSNRNAIKLYEKFNFQHLEYKNDNLIMELEI